MTIFGFTGKPWSGKSEAVLIAKQKNIPVIRMGDFVWNEVKKRNLSINSENVGHVAQEMRDEHGSTIWAKKTVDVINELTSGETVVIDGIRSMEEVDYFRSHLSDPFQLVAITASDELRYNRAKLRNREDDSTSETAIRNRDAREKKWGIDQVIEAADIIIGNESTLAYFQDKISKLFTDKGKD